MLHDEAAVGGKPHGPRKGANRRAFGRLRKLPSGRWQAAYTGPDAILYKAPTTFEDEDAARGWLKGERKLIDLDEWRPPSERAHRRVRSRETFAEFADAWLADRQVKGRPLKPRTRDHYRNMLDKFLLPTFGKRPLSAITPAEVDQWYRDLDARTPTYRAHAYSLLRTILASVDPTVLAANPARIRGAGSTSRRHHIEPLTLDELSALVDAMPEGRRLMVLLAAWCALRFGELAELRRGDIDVTIGVVKIRRGVVRTSAGVQVGTTKSDAGVRNVAVPPHLLPAIKAHLKDHTEPGRDALLFPAASGGHLAPSTFYGQAPTVVKGPRGRVLDVRGGHGYYRARVLAGRPDAHFHDLRHTGAVLAAQTGATLAELMARLGHSTPGAAMRYQHAAKDRDKVIAAALSKLASGEAP